MNMKIFLEHTTGKGEDAGATGDHFAMVFDGLGGTGAMRCRNALGEERTEAKIASAAAARAVGSVVREKWHRWNDLLQDTPPGVRRQWAKIITKELKQAIDRELLKETTRWKHDGDRRCMPTTMAGWITFPQPDGSMTALAVWAGDSRCYMMDGCSMRQVSVDDSHVNPGENAMTEILSHESPRMSNTICVDKPYQINCRCMDVRHAALLFACTDGWYNSLPSPMHMEYYMRLAFNECHGMEDVRQTLSSFIEKAIVITDDSCTICALGYVPGEPSFDTLAGAMLEPLSELEAQYIDAFPDKPALPEGDADAILRKLARQLVTMPSFINGLNAYIEKMGNMPEEPVGTQAGSALINDLRSRRERMLSDRNASRRECDSRIASEEAKLRQCVMGMTCKRVQVSDVGNSSFSNGWYQTTCTEAEKVSHIFKNINRLQEKMFSDRGGGYGITVRYTRPSVCDVVNAAPYLHDLTALLESITPVDGVFTGYRQQEVVEEPLSETSCARLIDVLLGDGGLTDAAPPDLTVTIAQAETIIRCRENIRAQKRKRSEIKVETDVRASLTDEDRAKISANYALQYARDMLREWYRTHARPEGIEISDKLAESCEKQLEKCWNGIDKRREEYREAYAAFERGVMALWEKYQVGYACDPEGDQGGCEPAAAPQPEPEGPPTEPDAPPEPEGPQPEPDAPPEPEGPPPEPDAPPKHEGPQPETDAPRPGEGRVHGVTYAAGAIHVVKRARRSTVVYSRRAPHWV